MHKSYTLTDFLSAIDRNYVPTGTGKYGAVLFADRYGRTEDTYRLVVDLRISETGERPISLTVSWCLNSEHGYTIFTYGIIDDAETVEFRDWFNTLRHKANKEEYSRDREARDAAKLNLWN